MVGFKFVGNSHGNLRTQQGWLSLAVRSPLDFVIYLSVYIFLFFSFFPLIVAVKISKFVLVHAFCFARKWTVKHSLLIKNNLKRLIHVVTNWASLCFSETDGINK
jgi:hypothetical protein